MPGDTSTPDDTSMPNGRTHAIGMERGRHTCRSSSPVEAGDREPRQRQRVREVDHVLTDRRLLRRARHCGIEESRRAVAAQIDGEGTVPGLCECRRHPVEGMGIVWKTVEQEHGESRGGAALVITDLQHPCSHRFDGRNRSCLGSGPLDGGGRKQARSRPDETSAIDHDAFSLRRVIVRRDDPRKGASRSY